MRNYTALSAFLLVFIVQFSICIAPVQAQIGGSGFSASDNSASADDDLAKRNRLRDQCGNTEDPNVGVSVCSEFLKMRGNDERDIEISYGNLGAAYLKLHEWQPCIAAFNAAAQHNPPERDIILIYSERGACYGWMEKYRQAVADFNVALKHDPDNAIDLRLRGLIEKNKLGQIEQGERDIKLAHDIDPNVDNE